MSEKSPYERLGGYDAVTAVADDLLPRLQGDPELARFGRHRGEDGVTREKQLLIDFLSSNATLDKFDVPQTEREEVVAFIESTKSDIVEA